MTATVQVIMAKRMPEVMARLWDGVCVPLALSFSYWIHWHTDEGNSWFAFPAHAVGKLLCGSQPKAPIRVVWTGRLNECFAFASTVKGLWDTGLPHSFTRRLCHADDPQTKATHTAVHGWHCLGAMFRRMREVLARGSFLQSPGNVSGPKWNIQ